LYWIRSSLKDLEQFPPEVQEHIGYALGAAQFGGKHLDAKPWKGNGPGVFEVLHAFQKKSTKGIATSQADKNLIARRLKDAIEDYKERYGKVKD
jgi:phage-related protein